MPDSAAQELAVLPNSGPNDTVVSFPPLGSDPAVLLIWPKFPAGFRFNIILLCAFRPRIERCSGDLSYHPVPRGVCARAAFDVYRNG